MLLHYRLLFFFIVTLSCCSSLDARRSYARKRSKNIQKTVKSPDLAINTNGAQFLETQRNNNAAVFAKLLPSNILKSTTQPSHKATAGSPSIQLGNTFPGALASKKKTQPFLVRVLLDERPTKGNPSWHLTSHDNFFVAADVDQLQCCKKGELYVSCRNGVLYLNGKQWHAKTCSVIPQSGTIDFGDKSYAGIFCIEIHDNTVYVINQVPLEEYVASVLHCESWPGWPVEVNKAFAIASRSYLVCKILESRKQKKPYHIKNTNIHQTYKGVHSSDRLRQAIEQTRGLILTHKEQPIEAMFDSCCGGIIPAHISTVNFKKAPYLARTYACTYCKSCKIYAWSVEYSPELMETLLQKAGHSIKQIKEIKISKKDRAGAVQSVLIKGASKSLQLSGKQMYSIFSKLKSFCYSVEKRGKSIVFKGRGYGHHLGICQWGARRMIDVGMNYASILQFYYPGTRLMELHAKL